MWPRKRVRPDDRAGDGALRPAVAAGREADRLEALSARRFALVGVPLVTAAWLVVILGWPDAASAVRIATVAAIVGSAGLAARAAATTVRFRRRWARDLGAEAPPVWVTLALVGAAIGATVAWSNVIADASEHTFDLSPLVAAGVFSAVVGVAAWLHVAGARGLAAELRREGD